MTYPRLIVYAFATFLAVRRPRGCRPATLGCLQTLGDLIDDWRTEEKGQCWWGDKTPVVDEMPVLRQAGISPDKTVLGPISPKSLYATDRW